MNKSQSCAALCGVLNVYKEQGFTSHDVVAVVRKTLHGIKTGHTGTLDPAAEGVLPVCVGKATKLADIISGQRKGYRAEVILGATTDTLDFTGHILETRPVKTAREHIVSAVKSLKGQQEQLPPMYSAIKVGGRKLYELARAGIEAQRTPRLITVYDISINRFISDERFVIDVLCSKGTYIRSLCASLGERLGCGAHMGHLLRTSVGDFGLEGSVKLNDIKNAAGHISDMLITVDKVLPHCTHVFVLENATKRLLNGNSIHACYTTYNKQEVEIGNKALLYDAQGNMAGIYDICGTYEALYFKPWAMLAT